MGILNCPLKLLNSLLRYLLYISIRNFSYGLWMLVWKGNTRWLADMSNAGDLKLQVSFPEIIKILHSVFVLSPLTLFLIQLLLKNYNELASSTSQRQHLEQVT